MRIAGEVPLPSLVPQGDIAGLGEDIFKQNVIGDPGMTIKQLEEAEKRRRLQELMRDIMEQKGPGGGSVRGV